MKSAKYILRIFITFFAFTAVSADDNDGFDTFGDDFAEINLPFGKESQKIISLKYGIVDLMIHNDAFKSDLSRLGIIEARFGSAEIKDKKFDSTKIKTYDISYLSLSNMSALFYDDAIEENLKMSSWTFGLGYAEGYGYSLGRNANIILYHGRAINWSRPNFKDAPLSDNDIGKLKPYNDDLRFGTEFEAGLVIQPIKLISIDATYTRTTVFPRTMFWYVSGSFLVEYIGEAIVDKFNNKIFKNMPYAGPITHFILRNAYSFAFSKLREKQMHFPFGSDTAPLVYDQYRVGLTFHF